MFELPNYQLISRGKYCSNHGGLFTYVHDDFHWEPMEIKEYSSGWENLFVKIQRKSKNSKKYIVGNIYRLPNLFLILQHLMKNSLKLWIFCIPKERPHIYVEILI